MHFLSKAAIFGQSNAGGGGGPTLGPELISNGSFENSSGWTLNAGWTVSGGTLNSAGNGDFAYYLNTGAVLGPLYRLEFDLVEHTGTDDLSISFGKAIGGIVYRFEPPDVGFISIDIPLDPAFNDTHLYFRDFPAGEFVGKIDNVSLREIL